MTEKREKLYCISMELSTCSAQTPTKKKIQLVDEAKLGLEAAREQTERGLYRRGVRQRGDYTDEGSDRVMIIQTRGQTERGLYRRGVRQREDYTDEGSDREGIIQTRG